MLDGLKVLNPKWLMDNFFVFGISDGKNSGSAPAVPDYKALAEAQAKGNLDLAKYVTGANRINQITPYGSLTYTNTPTFDQAGYDAALAKYNASLQGGHRGGHSDLTAPNRADFTSGDNWTATQTLTPAQQAILESGQKLNQSKLGYAQNILDKANAGKGGIDMSGLPSYGINPGETYSDAIMRRLAPTQASQQQAFESKMANQGIVPGTQAYDNAYRNFSQMQNDQLTSAITGGMGVGLQANQQAYNQAYQNANLPINQINALQGGSQVQNPNYVNSANMPQVQSADLVGAAQNTYNAQLGAYNAQNAADSGFMGGLMNLGAAAMKYSDIRLKTNIERIGTHILGIGIYAYDYVWGEHDIGVMAQELEEVMPDAVITMPNGFKAVNYAMLGA